MASPQSLEVARRARLIYDEQLREQLEREHANEFVAIEPESARFFLGATLSEAIQAARRAFPDRLPFALRIGHNSTVHLGALAS
ncbi:hypothetical protein [Lacipirellula limnantheis]|uniref:DUF5678 domain-containing protein n=1 Tax=Lacipirellula limnantheis TaxID=2528024 RepID=A0A517U680_9BACT|nr:hypothetical protein [Lacipirellula limnantheis]QDT76137.1 hypothetical protein I41_53820 [Lacipirellula limnantheis]